MSNIEMFGPKTYGFNAYHLGAQLSYAYLVSRGEKALFAKEAHVRTLDLNGSGVTFDLAEEQCHQKFGVGAIGRYIMGGLPYVLTVGDRKYEAALATIEKEYGVDGPRTVVTCDIALKMGGDTLFHKPATEEDINLVVQKLYHGAIRHDPLSVVVGIVRGDRVTGEREYFVHETNLGFLRQFDVQALTNVIRGNGHRTGGVDNRYALNHLVSPQPLLHVRTSKYKSLDDARSELVGGRFCGKNDLWMEVPADARHSVHQMVRSFALNM